MVGQIDDGAASEEQPKKRSGLGWILAGAAIFVVAAVVAVVLFTGKGDPVIAAAEGQAGTSAVQPPEVPADKGQAPGTVKLPGGGTAKLIRKELTADGTLPIPEGLDEATWWGAKLGADQGASLLSGHVNWKGEKGPFDELWRLKTGQEVSVVDTDGGKWVYKIGEIVTVHKTKLAEQAEKLFGPDGPHRLVLVTCGGEYVGGTDGYEDNRIVTASLVSRP
ncbi:class F sortase [Amycolatopsis regifaucium]|uniref:Sortase n=1 Tax=Amycolatopsis regifaucium TaxID=546365 RepID=A0A154MN82_9PSEU|nr:class F sortase [Amycolatopsis regifaucium]KZB85413.1 sortase [Amycolatopsis regifaucium]OKA08978.1 sortase [Amycolatopsis regifaucium]SFJ37898.1 Sortase family protein [Amycolatopsis regifaucium]